MEGEVEGSDREGCAGFLWVRWEASDGEREWVARLMGADEWFWDRRNGYYIFFVI